MKTRLYLLLALLCLACNSSFAQSYTIKGKVGDSLNSASLQYASVTLLRASDSILSAHARAGADGGFVLHPDSAGRYIVMVTFPGMADYIDIVKLDRPELDLGSIPMVSKTHLLQELVVKQQVAAIKIKGDTTEYMADSFAVRENATVDELLRRLPGLQVSRSGEIVAQGEKVQKILVDGEEFFADDPAVVTKNLQARTVEKVQVFDKKSDQAEFTGIDDGVKTKTINLQLKEDKKKGYFGKLALGGGTDQYFENQGMINAFKGKRKLAAFGIISNTDKVGLSWRDAEKYSSNNSAMYEYGDDGSMTTYITSDDDDFSSWSGSYNGQGLPRVWTGGLHYSNKWEQDKYHLDGNYRYAKQNQETEGNTITEYTLPNSSYFTKEHRNLFYTGQRHGANGLFEWKLDSLSSLKLTVNADYKETQNSSLYNSESLNSDGDTLNTGYRKLTTDASTRNENISLIYRKKFKKKGRTLSADVTEQYKNSESTGYLYTRNRFFLSSGFADSIVDQRKVNQADNMTLNGRLSYTEPLSKTVFAEFNYTIAVNNSESEKNSYDKNAGGEYTDSALNPLNSSHYRFDVLQHTGGANLRFVYKKYNFSFGAAASDARFRQTNLAADTLYHRSIDRHYTNFFPRASLVYNIAKQQSLRFNYSGSTNQPTIDQIQPLRNNTDPLNVPVGNPDLKQEFKQSVRLSYNHYKVLTGRYLWSSLSFNTTGNAISRSETITPLGSRTYQYVNVNGNYNIWGYLSYGFSLKKHGLDIGTNLSTSMNHVNNFVNGEKNTSNNNSYTGGLSFRYAKEEKISASLSPSVTYNDNRATISTYTTSYWSGGLEGDFNIELPKKLEIGTTIDWQLRQKTALFDNNNSVFRWNAWISKKMLKKNNLELRLSVFDILNQNVGFNRYAQSNYITQDNYNTIRRYGMLGIIWDFTHTPAGAPAN